MPQRCQCPTCRHSRATTVMEAALAEIENATEEWLERSHDTDGNFHFLRDEVEAVLAMDFADPQVRIRLSEALRITDPRESARVSLTEGPED